MAPPYCIVQIAIYHLGADMPFGYMLFCVKSSSFSIFFYNFELANVLGNITNSFVSNRKL